MLFKIGFLTVNWTDLLDIAIVSFLFYRLYLIMRGTIAVQIFIGLIVIIAMSFFSRAANLPAMTWILRTLTDIWVVAFIILFQPELRRLLLIVGRNPIFSPLLKTSITETIETVVDACEDLSRNQIGALIVIMRTTGLRMIIETGIHMHSLVSKPLILSIFNPKSPLHDGAIVIKDRFIEAARCTLPLSQHLQSDGFIMGMRHRSAVGVTEQSDAIVVIVSEETGIISVAEDGKLIRRLAGEELRSYLIQRMRPQTQGAFSRLFKMSTAEKADEI